MAIKVVSFDLDDTLWPVAPALERAENAFHTWLAQHRPATSALLSSTAETVARKKDLLRRRPELIHSVSAMRRTFLYELQCDAGYSHHLAKRGEEECFTVFLQARQQVSPYPEAESVLAELAQHFSLGTLTNGNADVHKTPLGQYLDFAFCAEDVGACKPEPALFRAALDHKRCAPAQMIHVGDHPEHDVAGAQALGIFSVWFNPTGKPWPRDEAADAEIRSLRELPDLLKSRL